MECFNKESSKITMELLKKMFINANEKFLINDNSLIINNVSERSWYTRLAIYLENEIKEKKIIGYCVDTEYNRNKGKLKTILDYNTEIIPVTCDIIVHSRGNNKLQDNLICIEMKKSTSSNAEKIKDRKRLKILTRKSYNNIWSADGRTLPEHVCGYLLGIYYEVNIRTRKILIEYYYDGECIEIKVI